ncbi:MAG: hypothetical protein M3R61_00440, partial [Chloroflexota bacterium]|nr:hypothetical protein [Chloroflexota bacterium]
SVDSPMLAGAAGLSPHAVLRRKQTAAGAPLTLGDFLLDHALIKGLSTDPYPLRKLLLRQDQHQPSYIPDRTFSLAMMDILLNLTQKYDQPISATNLADTEAYLKEVQKNLNLLPPELQHVLNPMIGVANDVDTARRNLESWFNAKMDRVTGSYKRWTQFVLLILAVLVSAGLNADTFTVGRSLWVSPTLRQAVVAQADQRLAAGEVLPPAENQFQDVQRSVQDTLIFPIGWSDWCLSPPQLTGGAANRSNCTPVELLGWLQKVAGLLLTALAISLGAPFWFDLLGKVSKLRSSGPTPGAKDSATVAQPRSS